MSESRSGSGNGCGCVSFIVFILAMSALWFGLPTPWGEFNIDILPPAIRLEKAEPEQ